MINFGAVDFSECRSEEGMFLLTLSVWGQIFKNNNLLDTFLNGMRQLLISSKF